LGWDLNVSRDDALFSWSGLANDIANPQEYVLQMLPTWPRWRREHLDWLVPEEIMKDI